MDGSYQSSHKAGASAGTTKELGSQHPRCQLQPDYKQEEGGVLVA